MTRLLRDAVPWLLLLFGIVVLLGTLLGWTS